MASEACQFSIMTYNVHRCIGLDHRTSPARIAEVIAESVPDIVALQELPGGRHRSGGGDLAVQVMDELSRLKQPYRWLERERCGNVILSRYPLRLIKAGGLHPLHRRRSLIPRGVVWVEAEVCGRPVQLFNTHLGLTPRERSSQVQILLGPEWLQDPECKPPVVLCGDFNALPRSAVHQRLSTMLSDVQISLARSHAKTWPSRYPFMKIDHLFLSPGLDPVSVDIPQNHLTRVASDHLPLIVHLRFLNDTPPEPSPAHHNAPSG